MSTDGEIKLSENRLSEDNGREVGTLNNKELTGTITTHIGTGQNAKDSFVWMTITWSFYIASALSLMFFFRSFFDISKGENLLDSIVNIWTTFVPIITLTLGYAFGKGK